jgi:CheY-like chemotaxis protein
MGEMNTILLVEDDPLQAFVRMSALEKRFKSVRRVVDAVEALCLIEQHSFADNLSLVITGNHLPGLGGPAFVAELCNRMPALGVLVLGNVTEVASDYAHERVRFLGRTAGTDEMLQAAGEMMQRDGQKVA